MYIHKHNQAFSDVPKLIETFLCGGRFENAKYINYYVCSITMYVVQRIFSSIFSRNFEENASEFLKNIEEMLTRYLYW